jgi:hypothetical protein
MLSTLNSVDPINALGASDPSSLLSSHSGSFTAATLPGLQDPIQGNFVSQSSASIDPNLIATSHLTSVTPLLPIDALIPLPMFIDPGNTITTANSLGSLNSTVTVNEFVGSSDTSDFYHLNLNSDPLLSGNKLNLSLTGLSADADVRVYDMFGNVVASSTRAGAADEAINLAGLAAGDYYAEVFQYSGDTGYTLNLSPNSPNNLLATETDIGLLSGTQVFSGSIGNSNTSDTYRFSVNDFSFWGMNIPRNVNFTLSGLSSDADIRLIFDSNNNGLVDGTDVLAESFRGGNQAEWISNFLYTGNYFLQVNQWSGNTDYHLSASTGDWFSNTMTDAGVIGESRYAAANGVIDRNEMIAVFNEVEKAGYVSDAALNDMRSLVNNGSSFGMQSHVQNLAGKVVNGNIANTMYQGSYLGNLYAGTSATHLENLVNKWFLGTDLPYSVHSHSTAAGSLFGADGTFSFTDVRQGGLGDCYFLASLASLAQQFPSAIQNMFIDNGDGTFSVRFFGAYDGTVTTGAEYVTVNRELTSAYAYHDAGDVGLWVALAEKAFAQFAEQGLSQRPADPWGYVANSYSSIEGGWGFQTMPVISGWNGGYYTGYSSVNGFANREGNFMSLSDIATNLANGWALTADTIGSPETHIVGQHEYMIVSADLWSNTVTLYNPWGFTQTISYDDLAENFYMINLG